MSSGIPVGKAGSTSHHFPPPHFAVQNVGLQRGYLQCKSHSGGSALSPAAVISPDRAQQQAVALAKEVGCPTSSIQEVVSCLRQKPANILNDAQTK
ncbi:hypothetical protein A6R68_04001, partial [Neotoma lepida]